MRKEKSPGRGRQKKKEIEREAFEITEKIRNFPNNTLVRIGCAINRHEWIEELPGKPDGWEEMTESERHLWSAPIFEFIEVRVGYKAMLRYHHTVEGNKTDQEFEDWWDSHYHSTLSR